MKPIDIFYVQPNNLEQAVDIAESLIKTDIIKIIILNIKEDSLNFIYAKKFYKLSIKHNCKTIIILNTKTDLEFSQLYTS